MTEYVHFDVSFHGTYEFEDGEVERTEQEITEHFEQSLRKEYDSPLDPEPLGVEARVSIRREHD